MSSGGGKSGILDVPGQSPRSRSYLRRHVLATFYGFQLNAANIAHCRETGDCSMEPECSRLQGELALLGSVADHAAAERLFREALAIAASHSANSWELRAAMSLARLLQINDQHEEATALLVPILESFKEGLDTADCIETRALIASLD